MLPPIFKINNRDYAQYIAEDGLKPSRNDLDADGSGRNILNGLMYRKRIATKLKWTVSFNRLDAATMNDIETAMAPEYVSITLLEPKGNRYVERTYYCSTINNGVQRQIGDETYYDGVTFDIIER